MEVDLRLAFEWTCEECGRDIFEHAITIDKSSFDKEELEEIIESFGLDEHEEGVLQMAPQEVLCPYCKIKYKIKMDYV